MTVTDQDGHAIGHGCARPEPKAHRKRAGPRPPGPPGFTFTPASRDGPPRGHGTWRLRTPGPGPDLIVTIDPLTEEDEVVVRQLVYHHLEATESARAHELLGSWPNFAGKFRKVRPRPPAAKPAEAKPPAATEATITENVVAVQP